MIFKRALANLRSHNWTALIAEQYLRTAISRNNDYFADPLVVYLRSQSIGAGFTNPDSAANIPLAPIEKSIASVWLERFGSIDPGAASSSLRLPPSAPFWEGLRANLSWRGYGAVANENLLRMIMSDARKMRAQVEPR